MLDKKVSKTFIGLIVYTYFDHLSSKFPTFHCGHHYENLVAGSAIRPDSNSSKRLACYGGSILLFYNSDQMTGWKNNLFIAALNTPHIIRIVIEDNKVTGEERLLEAEKQRLRDITVGRDGALYAITDSGRMFRIAKK